MEIVFMMLSVSLVIGLLFFAGFAWANKNSQFKNLDLMAFKVLEDEHEHVIAEGDTDGKKA